MNRRRRRLCQATRAESCSKSSFKNFKRKEQNMTTIALVPPPAGDTAVIQGRKIVGLPGQTVQVSVGEAIELIQRKTGWTGTVPTQFGPITVTEVNVPAVFSNGQWVDP